MEQDGWNDNLPQATQQIPQTTVEPTEQDADTVAMRNLLQSVVQIGLGAKAIHDQQAYTQQILANLAAQVNGIALAQTSSTTTTAPSGTSRNAPKFREPRIFTGKASDVEAFLNEMRDAVQLSRGQLPVDRDRSIYMGTYLGDGSPKSWYNSVRKHNDSLLDNFTAFCERFEAHFGDPDVTATAQEKLLKLRQDQFGSCAAYVARFEELLPFVDWSDQSSINTFYKGLKPRVKDGLVSVLGKPTIFRDYTKLCIEIDNVAWRREQERKTEKSSSSRNDNTLRAFPAPRPSTAATPGISTAISPGVPMEIDATKLGKPHGPLSQKERDDRRAKGLCLYCGGPHKIANCPNMSEAAKKRFTDRQKAKAAPSGKA